ncbi:unnamed protein product [Symbiodinium necroappetens]|uniref:Ferric oxidoreductase domain-containing protein n=1 Tax=Symbiodinium necroappetens TaxID=1628268 RepID=A0A812QWF0_9DINO|nr:unnamed protein product [Symbiodinium necroappetens]
MATNGSMPSLASSVKYMLLASALYEPLRNALHNLGTNVGGVGGVGGLCNMGNPDDCESLAGRTGNYCFQAGLWSGLTGFALVVLLVWTSPIFLGALQKSVSTAKPVASEDRGRDSGDEPGAEPSPEPETASIELDGVLMIWSGLSCLWFGMPLAYMLADPFYRSSALHFVLAVALAAAFPLSWHLSLLALPPCKPLGPWLGLKRQDLLNLHKALGWRAAGWGAIHALGELIYVVSQQGFLSMFQLAGEKGENLLYLMGLVTALLLLVHTLVAYLRRQAFIRRTFKATHRTTASFLLLSATVHWWPFALFLLPAAAAYGTSAGLGVASQFGRQVSEARNSFALAAAVLGAFAGLCVVWKVRESVMLAEGVGLLIPFVFPPLALLAEFAVATAVCLPILVTGPVLHSEPLLG